MSSAFSPTVSTLTESAVVHRTLSRSSLRVSSCCDGDICLQLYLHFSFSERNASKKAAKQGSEFDIPIFKDPSEMQAYFLTQVQLSDELMQIGMLQEWHFDKKYSNLFPF